jgi:hypothetical protein
VADYAASMIYKLGAGMVAGGMATTGKYLFGEAGVVDFFLDRFLFRAPVAELASTGVEHRPDRGRRVSVALGCDAALTLQFERDLAQRQSWSLIA